MRYLSRFALAAWLALFMVSQAFAQASCPIGAEAPKTTAATTYTLSPADHCSMIVFTSGSSVAVTMPNANTLPPGFRVWIKAQGAGTVTLNTPTVSTIDGQTGTVAYTQGTGAEVLGDNINYYTTGLGIKHP